MFLIRNVHTYKNIRIGTYRPLIHNFFGIIVYINNTWHQNLPFFNFISRFDLGCSCPCNHRCHHTGTGCHDISWCAVCLYIFFDSVIFLNMDDQPCAADFSRYPRNIGIIISKCRFNTVTIHWPYLHPWINTLSRKIFAKTAVGISVITRKWNIPDIQAAAV